jgi:hypothetical protein
LIQHLEDIIRSKEASGRRKDLERLPHLRELRRGTERQFRKDMDMTELVHVTAVEVVGDHRLRLAFEDGVDGEVDLSSWNWRGVFEPLADPEYFRQVSLDEESGTIVWPNGADMAPETLHRWVVRAVKPTSV